MSPVNWVNPLPASTIVDKVQNVQQMQADIHQAQTEAKALRQEKMRQTKVNTTSDGEKVRLDQSRKDGRRKKHKSPESNETGEETKQSDEKRESKAYKPVDLTV